MENRLRRQFSLWGLIPVSCEVLRSSGLRTSSSGVPDIVRELLESRRCSCVGDRITVSRRTLFADLQHQGPSFPTRVKRELPRSHHRTTIGCLGPRVNDHLWMISLDSRRDRPNHVIDSISSRSHRFKPPLQETTAISSDARIGFVMIKFGLN